MKRTIVILALLGGCTDPDVIRADVPPELPLARVLRSEGGQNLIVVSNKLYGRCYALAVAHERRHIADPTWVHGHEPFVCRQSVDSLTGSFLVDVPTTMTSRSKGGTNATFPGICDKPVNGGPETAFCRKRNAQ